MKTWLRCVFVSVAACLLLLASAAHAMPITVSFTATGFVPVVGSAPAPDDPVSGIVVYDATSINSPINSLTSISLTISGHTYTLAEIGFINEVGGVAYVGGLIDGVTGSGSFEDDFLLGWDMTSLVPLIFLYATPDFFEIWVTSQFAAFSVTGAAAPEPHTFALLALASLIMLANRGRGLKSRSR